MTNSMKKVAIALLTLLLCCSQAFGQSLYRAAFRKGTFATSANFSLGWGTISGNYDYEGINSTSHTITPRLGFFPANGILIGIVADFSSTKYSNYDVENTSKENTYGPVIRVYTPDGFFVHLDFTIGKTSWEYFDGYINWEVNTKIRKFQFGTGYAFLIGRSVAIEPLIMYQDNTGKSDRDSNFDFDKSEFIASVGLSYFFHKK